MTPQAGYKPEWLFSGLQRCHATTTGGTDAETWGGTVDSGCLAIHYAVKLTRTVDSWEAAVRSGAGTAILSSGTAVGTKDLTARGGGRTDTSLTLTLINGGQTLLFVLTGKLPVKGIGISHRSSKASHLFHVTDSGGSVALQRLALSSPAQPLSKIFGVAPFRVYSGTLILESCVVSSLTLDAVSLFSVGVPGGVTFTGTQFEGITRVKGGGAVMSGRVRTGTALTVSNTTMEGCQSETGDGGAVCDDECRKHTEDRLRLDCLVRIV